MRLRMDETMPSRRAVACGLATALMVVATGAAVAPAHAADDTYEGKKPAGTISFKQFQAGYLASAGGGEGVLNFQGQKYAFSIGASASAASARPRPRLRASSTV